jgi:hypothetical protein
MGNIANITLFNRRSITLPISEDEFSRDQF